MTEEADWLEEFLNNGRAAGAIPTIAETMKANPALKGTGDTIKRRRDNWAKKAGITPTELALLEAREKNERLEILLKNAEERLHQYTYAYAYVRNFGMRQGTYPVWLGTFADDVASDAIAGENLKNLASGRVRQVG